MLKHPEDARPVSLQTMAADLRVIIGKLRRRLRDEANPGDFTPSQLTVLGRLERDGPTSVTALARVEGMRPQSMGAIMAGLETLGMVRGVRHPSDGRQTLFSLTDACSEWIRRHRAAREDWLQRAIAAELAPNEQQILATALALLMRITET